MFKYLKVAKNLDKLHFLHVVTCNLCCGDMTRPSLFFLSVKEQDMKKITVIVKQVLERNFKQAYAVLMCKCNCWEQEMNQKRGGV